MEMEKFVIGIVRNPYNDNALTTVIGYEFADSPGYFWFYSVRGSDKPTHFRKRPDANDDIWPISWNVYMEFRDRS